jgi:pimeloyl-ACP methyl ester carboxylesterase
MNGFDDDERARHALLADAARGVRVPTLLVRGASSDVVSAEGMRELTTLIPQVRMVEIDGAGHLITGESFDPFSTAIVEFVLDPAHNHAHDPAQ